MSKRSLDEIKKDAKLFATCTDITDLQNKLKISGNDLLLFSLHPRYYCFTIRKQSGGLREIETPAFQLKELQRKLNYYLQAYYYMNQSSSSYGYIISPGNRKNYKNIVKNAEQHLGNRYMMKVDFDDFFHQIKTRDVMGMFLANNLSFTQKAAHTLASVCTNNDRLPMGAPTSPVLSNLFALELDHTLEKWAGDHAIIYSRFVDDLTFSSGEKEITNQHFAEVRDICLQHNLILNPEKTKLSGPGDEKIVTGLVLNKTVDIHPEFYKQLDMDLQRLKSIYEATLLTNQFEDNPLLKKFKQEVQGQVNFIGMVEGYRSPIFKDYLNRYHQALEADEELFTMRWTNLSYL